jgi:dTDP-4-dehydrorhamnose reductase
MKVLVLGASGMIGSAMFRVLSDERTWCVYGTLRSDVARRYFPLEMAQNLLSRIEVEKPDEIRLLLSKLKPDVVLNCIGLTKHRREANDPVLAISVNALFPHVLAELCESANSRLIQFSTDCVFSGRRGAYSECDESDATDLYGKTKFIGELNQGRAITLRTSTIGHELNSQYGLLEWFLAQQGQCKGFRNAIFSGLPNTTFAKFVRDSIIPRSDLYGLYHVGATPICKYDLLRLIANVYSRSIVIEADEKFKIDRSLNSERIRLATGYVAPAWPDLIESMREYQVQRARKKNHVEK